jgi:hypothetical protein
MDLVIFYSPEKCCVTYYINNDSAGYKIEYPFSYIKNITLESGDSTTNAEGAAQRPGGLIVELNRPPNFFMDSSGSFYQCGDFTEDQQASQVLVHHLGGHPKVLSGQLAKLISLESFQNRHSIFDPNAIIVSAPVSPINHRPASQPNHMVHPHFPAFQEGGSFGPSLHPGIPRGHKRQRSRSVPIAVDFSMLRHPMPSFLAPPEPTPYMPQNSEIFAPIPQHHSGSGPIGPNLSIDTSAGYGMDFRQYPMSATTANSPSEYGTPAFFSSGQVSESVPAANFGAQYNLPFLSPMPEQNGIAQSVSPMPMTHGDPVIANQSPPLTSVGRGGSAELYNMSQELGVSDETVSLSDLYSKQHISLPFRSPLEQQQDQVNMDELNMQSLVSFDTIDPASLSPEHQGQMQ